MRWLAAMVLVACGTDEAGDDTGQPVGLVEVFDVDCSFQPKNDGRVMISELLGGPVAIVQFEVCHSDGSDCYRIMGDAGLYVLTVYSDDEGIWLDPDQCDDFASVRVLAIR